MFITCVISLLPKDLLLSHDVASESVLKPCIKNDNIVCKLCFDVHKNVAFSKGETLTFLCKNCY